ncbi:MAG TPA: GNAT family N-acetyltransferase [Geomonas sp.]
MTNSGLRIRRTLGRFKRGLFASNSAIWFCGALAARPDWHPSSETRIVFEDFEAACAYIGGQSARFPWIASPGELAAARRWGHYYPLIYHAGEIAGYIKIALGKAYVEDFDALIGLQQDEAFVCDTFIDPEFRGKGLSKELVGATAAWLRERGMRYLFCHIPEWNAASLKLYRGLGFKSIRKVNHVRVCGMRYYSTPPEQVFAAGRLLHRRAAP